MKTYEFQGKNVEKAIAQGLKELNKSQYDVDIKILESGGLFKKAKVQIIVNDEDDFASQIKSEINAELDSSKEKPKVAEKELEAKVEAKAEKKAEKKVAEKLEDKSISNDNVVKPVVIETVVQETITVESDNQDQPKPAKQRVYSANKGTKEFLKGLFEKLGVEATVEIVEEDEHTKALVQTEKAGLVIGHKGEALSAIQYLANIVEQKQNRYAKRVIVDVADYREKRDDSLKDLADRMARKVLKYKKSVKLSPMNAYDRRIVHTYLQNFKGVTTHSVGVEPHRCLIIDVDRS